MFNNNDLALVKILTNLMANKIKFDGMSAKDINSAYHCFEFINNLSEKMEKANDLEYQILDLEETIDNLENELKGYEEATEEKEKKPKRKSRKKE